MLRYIQLIKPGIVLGNLITAAAGFFLASGSAIDWSIFAALILGTCLIISGACILNNVIDKNIDSKMQRTKSRASLLASITPRVAIICGAVFATGGFLILLAWINTLTALVGALGFFAYVFIYGFAKRHTHHSTLIGTVSGATPPVAGYTAASGQVDTAAIILFFVLVFWQMPHFYAIAIRRIDEYKKAKLPMLPIVKGLRRTKIEMLIYGVLFVFAISALYTYGYAGFVYIFFMMIIALFWLGKIWEGFFIKDNGSWSKSVFGISLFVLLAFSLLISIDSYLF